MKDLSKVSTTQIISLSHNMTLGLLTIIAVVVGSKLLPFYLSPIVGLIGSSFLFSMLYTSKIRGGARCMLIPYSLFFCLIIYSFVSILVNVLYIWGLMKLPDEFIFFNDPYIPTLWLNPISFLTLLVIYIRRRRLRLCIDCRLKNGSHTVRGIYGSIVDTEKKFQLRNLIILSGVLTIICWSYYLIKYESINTNGRDSYIFFWITVLALGFDVLYFIYRYYNLYLDLKENNEIIYQSELRDMTAKTYLRFYVICDNKIFLDTEIQDPRNIEHTVIDSPFFTNRSVNGITLPEVKHIIKEMTGGKDGELRFFFGRRSPEFNQYSLLRYFYFLDGKPEDYPEMNVKGEWVDFDTIKLLYSKAPGQLGTLLVNDLSRLATIMVTEKTFNANGTRKVKLRSYQPTFDLHDVRETDLDFQDDKWIRISLFNSDTRFFKLKKIMRKLSFRDR